MIKVRFILSLGTATQTAAVYMTIELEDEMGEISTGKETIGFESIEEARAVLPWGLSIENADSPLFDRQNLGRVVEVWST